MRRPPARSSAPPPFTTQELDSLLAPIALYPDGLLSQVLMASTYPLEVVQAARWSKANPGLSGDDAVKKVGQGKLGRQRHIPGGLPECPRNDE
jgi:hypothetical protein